MRKVRQKKILMRITAIFIICFAIMLGLGTIVLIDILIKPVEQMENMSIQNELSNVQKAIDYRINNLSTLVKVWADSDDSYRFFQDGSNTNLPDTSLANLDVSMMLYMNNDGHVVSGKSVQPDDSISNTVSQSVLNCLSRLKTLWVIDADYGFKGVWTLPEGPMLVASYPVMKSDEGAVVGHIVFGQYLDDKAIKELSNSLDLNIGISMIDAKEYTQLKATNYQSFGIINVVAIDSNKIEGSRYVPDVLNYTALKMTVTQRRDIYNVGQTTVMFTVITVAVIFFVVLLLLWTLINKYVIKRITNLHKDVTKIAEGKDLSGRVEINGGSDEIYYLSDNINNMLDVTEKLNLEVQKANRSLERRSVDLAKANEALIGEKEKIKHMAYHDSLTNLPNGVYFNDYLNRQIMSADRLGMLLAVLFIDLDGFKMINDTLGHAAGDELLVSVARRLCTVLRKSDFVARIGGDEFIILINNIHDAADIETIANKILKKLSEPFTVTGQECFISASIGISQYPFDGSNAEELTKNADLAMYKAKDGGKGRHCFCSREMKEQIIENMVLSNQLWRALERHEFELYYQPQVNCYTSEIIGMEALIRWNHAERGLVLPGKFITLAEQTGAINSIGEWVLKTAVRQCKLWQDEYLPDLRMAVNLSVKQLQNDDIVYHVRSILEETRLNPDSLELEVTESVFVKEVEFVINILNKLKTLGVEIAIDDFGTEYASMNYLKHMPINRIKIAMPFIQGLDVSEKDKAITKAIIILAKNMGMSVIAEGVETKSQHDFLMRKLCDETQGFYFYQPLPAKEIEKILKQQCSEKRKGSEVFSK
jgi:diguanylate cyclase (GGDEF)-like protein